MLNAAIYIVFALLLIVSSLLLLVVLMQRPKNEGLGAAFGAQMTDQAFGAQTTDVLKKGTVVFGTLFMLLCFVLGVLMNRQFQNSKSELATTSAPIVNADAPATPVTTPVNLEQFEAALPAIEPAPAPAADAAPAEDAAVDVVEESTPAPAPAEEAAAEEVEEVEPAPAEEPAPEPAPAA